MIGGGTKPSSAAPGASWRGWAGRSAIALGAMALLLSARLPYWRMNLTAPQYPKGLALVIYLNRIEGDVREFDALNHYIGMRALEHGAQAERRAALPALALTLVGLLVTLLLRRRWAMVCALPALALPALFAADLYWWMRDYGLNLNPKAPLNHSIKPFVPPILGEGKIAQFHVHASFEAGFQLAVLASVAAAIGLWLKFGARKRFDAASLGLALSLLLIGGQAAEAGTLTVGAGSRYRSIPEALAAASDGDTILVEGGAHRGPLVIAKSVALIGHQRPILDGGGIGTVVRIDAPRVTLSGFVIRGSGDILSREDAGLVVSAPDARIEDNQFEDVLFGVSFRRASRGVLRGNTLRSKPLPVPRRGDLIRVWYSDEMTIEENRLVDGRDAVLWFSQRSTIQRNSIQAGRYGLHFMYCDDAVVEENELRDNSVGVYLMYSTRLRLRRNRMLHSHGPSGYGLGLKDMEQTTIEENVLADNRVGIFMEHATGIFARNLIGYNEIGIRLFSSAQRNLLTANSFMENGEQVSIDGPTSVTSNRWEGNYWSDYRGFDRDGDGIGDVPYRSTRLFEQLTDHYPAFRLYAGSPAAQAIDFAAQVFPLFAPHPKLADERPRMAPIFPPLPFAPTGRSA